MNESSRAVSGELRDPKEIGAEMHTTLQSLHTSFDDLQRGSSSLTHNSFKDMLEAWSTGVMASANPRFGRMGNLTPESVHARSLFWFEIIDIAEAEIPLQQSHEFKRNWNRLSILTEALNLRLKRRIDAESAAVYLILTQMVGYLGAGYAIIGDLRTQKYYSLALSENPDDRATAVIRACSIQEALLKRSLSDLILPEFGDIDSVRGGVGSIVRWAQQRQLLPKADWIAEAVATRNEIAHDGTVPSPAQCRRAVISLDLIVDALSKAGNGLQPPRDYWAWIRRVSHAIEAELRAKN